MPAPLRARSGAPGDRPNILVIMSDEHNPRVTGCYGSRIVHTPRLDQIAERRDHFRRLLHELAAMRALAVVVYLGQVRLAGQRLVQLLPPAQRRFPLDPARDERGRL